MAKHRTYSIEFKRQVAQEYIAGETLHALAKRHDLSRNLIRIWVAKYESGVFEDDIRAADLLQEYEAKINSGDLISISEVVRDLYRADNQPEQSYSERQLYEAALEGIVLFLVLVTGFIALDLGSVRFGADSREQLPDTHVR